MSASNELLWVVVPYVAIAIFVLGHVWRYRYDKFGWTTRSSQLYEKRLLRIGSPLFHFGMLMVIGGHFVGLLIPESATHAIGISERVYHDFALTLGSISGVMTITGMAILIYRRRVTGPVFSATTRNDKIMYVLLGLTILLGVAATATGIPAGHAHDYRLDIAPWFRSIFYFQPDTSLIASAPVIFRLHVLSAWMLFAFWPFSRLVHVFSAPVGYLTRPYIVYRTRDTSVSGLRPVPRGWERVGSRAASGG
jgi:nitrate reductase gamma subunit